MSFVFSWKNILEAKKKLYEDNIAFTLQNDDGRIVFVIPFKEEFSLIGTTEVEVNSPDDNKIDEFEKNYLIDCVNNYFIKQINKNLSENLR